MSGIFDRLQREIEERRKDEGISPLDLMDLPAPLRKVMRILLREVEMSYTDLRRAVENMPKMDRLSTPELDQSLEVLSKQNWLIRRGEGDRVSYKVNLRRKRGSQLAQSIWTSLDDRIEGEKK